MEVLLICGSRNQEIDLRFMNYEPLILRQAVRNNLFSSPNRIMDLTME